jgi:mono/diheme cytochrome c family protein
MKAVAVYLANIFLLMTWHTAVAAAQSNDVSQGRKLFQEKCVICHGADGKGHGPAAAAFSKRPADFTKSAFWHGDVDKKISDTIRNGHQPMPAFSLSADEIQAIIDYMKQAFEK